MHSTFETAIKPSIEAAIDAAVKAGIEAGMKLANERMPRIEDYVRIFHCTDVSTGTENECGGAITGPLDDMYCSECGEKMTEMR